MGIFSFFHRKSDKSKAAAALKAHAYDSTSVGSLPTQGAYPVSGNGPNVIDTLSRGRPILSQIQSPLDDYSPDEPSAPAPGVPLYRNEITERPSTAPNGRPPSFLFSGSFPRQKKSHVKKQPPVSFRMFSNNGSIAPGSRPTSQGSEFTGRARAHSRSNSIRSDGGKGFKDILDAHSEIAPSDFRARVKATGARDYGEDVADRNLGANGFNLESTQVKNFYAQTGAPPPNKPSVVPLSQRSSRASMREVTQARWPKPTTPRVIPKGFTASVPRYKSTESGLYNDVKSKGGGHLIRRVSVNTYMPPTSLNNTSSVSLTRARGNSIKSENNHKLDIDISGISAPIILGPPKSTKEAIIPRTPRIPRDSVLLAKRKAEMMVSDRMVDELHSSPERTFSIRSATTITRSGSVAAASTFPFPRKRHSLHTLQSSISSTIASNRDSTFFQATTPLAYPRSIIAPHHQQQQQVVFPEEYSSTGSSPPVMMDSEDAVALVDFVDSSTLPFQKNQPSTIHEEESSSSRPLSRCFPLVSTTSRPIASTNTNTAAPVPVPGTPIINDIIAEQPDIPISVPIRTRSLRGWSASSGTPTATSVSVSGRSSSPSYLRPTTANTSIDLNYCPASSFMTTTALSPPPTPKSEDDRFNIDDYVSDDEGSSTGSKGENDEDLLFKDLEGYGKPGDGFELPGLPGGRSSLFGSVGSNNKVRGVRSLDSVGEETEEEYGYRGGGDYGWEYDGIGDSFGRVQGRRVMKRYVLDCGADDDEVYDGEYGDEREMRRFGALGSGEEVQDDDDGVEVDVMDVVRLRKEVKKARRAAGLPGAGGLRVKRLGVKEVRRVPVLCVEGEEI
ncbi:hypothetical protein QBC43DRAFT_23657 [Cladorrhinum sp. PSN259]|nr:hypothetical protein QBC43DRAFT_23657 [Cladorrhinum sp. PSN259]